MKRAEPITASLVYGQAVQQTGLTHGNSPSRWPSDPRCFKRIRPGSGAIEVEVMDYAKEAQNLRPLLILSPIDFPFPPSIDFCETMKQNGYRVVYIRRLGFGGTPELPRELLTAANIKNGAAMMAEVAVIMRVIATMNLENVVLLGISSANSICYRLCQTCPEISFTVFSHPIFNQDNFRTVRPSWIQPLARQIILTKQGFRLAARGLRFKIKRNPIAFYDEFYSKSSADLKYRQDNNGDFLSASQFVVQITAETLFYEVFHTLTEDSFLRDRLFLNIPSVALIGSETTPEWIENAISEADRLGVSIVNAPVGGILTAYTSPDQLIRVINSHLPETK